MIISNYLLMTVIKFYIPVTGNSVCMVLDFDKYSLNSECE